MAQICVRRKSEIPHGHDAKYDRYWIDSTTRSASNNQEHVRHGSNQDSRAREYRHPDELPAGVIVSPDTRAAEAHSARPVPYAKVAGAGRQRPARSRPGRVEIPRSAGLVGKPVEWSWEEFAKLPRVRVFADFHCVTRWSRLGNLWEGVSTRELVESGRRRPARSALRHWCTATTAAGPPTCRSNDFLAEDALVAILHDGEPIATEHGGPARLIVPRLYAWKSAKWVAGVELMEEDRAGFWEANGYHMRGDPWTEERYGL